MSITTMELYDALISAGVDEEKAKEAAKAVISREEALQSLATKSDLKDLKVEFYKALAVQTIVIVGAVVSLLQVLS